MAKKQVTAVIKLQCPAGSATPAPPIGPALGPHGVPAPKFVQEFNDRTKSMEKGLIIPVVISVYSDKSFTFISRLLQLQFLLKRLANLKKVQAMHFAIRLLSCLRKILKKSQKQKCLISQQMILKQLRKSSLVLRAVWA